MKISKLKVRPRKDIVAAPCAAEFAAMLACWASSNDLSNRGTCAETGRMLQDCMKQSVSTCEYCLSAGSHLSSTSIDFFRDCGKRLPNRPSITNSLVSQSKYEPQTSIAMTTARAYQSIYIDINHIARPAIMHHQIKSYIKFPAYLS